MPEDLPKRIKLPHHIPNWVPQGERYFISVNLKKRGGNDLIKPEVAQALLGSLSIYENQNKWFMHVMVVMPDHVHFIATMNLEYEILPVLRSWKGFFAKTLDLQWQSGFFEHRIRNDKEYEEKAAYIRLNPVRKGLVDDWEDWPYFWSRYENL